MTLKQERYFSIFLLPTITFFVLLAIFPLFYAIVLSVTDYGLTSGQSYKFIGIANYSELLNDQLFRIALKNTLTVVGVATVFELIIGFLLATILYSYVGRFRRHIQALLILPIAMAPVAIALMWKYILNSTYGVANYFLNSFGIKGIDWLGSNEWALISVAIVDIWQWTPFVLIIMLAGFESIPITTMEMARTDGAGKLQLLRFFMLPQLKAFIVVAILLRVIDAFKLFDTVYVLTEGGPGSSTEILSLLGHRLGFQFFRTGFASAESIILLIVISLLTYILMNTIRQVI
jgi:multiple sugar transport system permease protein